MEDNNPAHNGFDNDTEDDRYLIFRIHESLYGTPLLRVREVVERYSPKPIPNAPDFFAGVVNIRGEIVGVIDLRVRFGYPRGTDPSQALIVMSTNSGPMSCLVDQVESVIILNKKEIEKKANTSVGLKDETIIGIAKKDNKLIILIDLVQVVEYNRPKLNAAA